MGNLVVLDIFVIFIVDFINILGKYIILYVYDIIVFIKLKKFENW